MRLLRKPEEEEDLRTEAFSALLTLAHLTPGRDGGLFFPDALLLLSPFLSVFFFREQRRQVFITLEFLFAFTFRNLHGDFRVNLKYALISIARRL